MLLATQRLLLAPEVVSSANTSPPVDLTNTLNRNTYLDFGSTLRVVLMKSMSRWWS